MRRFRFEKTALEVLVTRNNRIFQSQMARFDTVISDAPVIVKNVSGLEVLSSTAHLVDH